MATVETMLKKDWMAVETAIDFVRRRVDEISAMITKQMGPMVVW
jgi:hypothetical protein